MTSRLVEVEAVRGDFPSSAEERQGLKGSEAPRIEPQLLQGRRTWGYNPPLVIQCQLGDPEMSDKLSLKWKQHLQLNGNQYAGDHTSMWLHAIIASLALIDPSSRSHERIQPVLWLLETLAWPNQVHSSAFWITSAYWRSRPMAKHG